MGIGGQLLLSCNQAVIWATVTLSPGSASVASQVGDVINKERQWRKKGNNEFLPFHCSQLCPSSPAATTEGRVGDGGVGGCKSGKGGVVVVVVGGGPEQGSKGRRH